MNSFNDLQFISLPRHTENLRNKMIETGPTSRVYRNKKRTGASEAIILLKYEGICMHVYKS